MNIEVKSDEVVMSLRPRNAAKALGISERALWEYTKQGLIPHVRVGRTVLYPLGVLRSWLKRETAGISARDSSEIGGGNE
jgi:excisionase family DNA binding protein